MRSYISFNRDEIQRLLPYELICETRYGSKWDTEMVKKRWLSGFSEKEREAASAIFSKARSMHLTTGVPDSIMMENSTYLLWCKIGKFCASI